jgi:hypothetical protein
VGAGLQGSIAAVVVVHQQLDAFHARTLPVAADPGWTGESGSAAQSV